MKSTNRIIWTNEAKDRYFLIPDDAALSDGSFHLRTATGKTWLVDENDALEFAIDEKSAKEWLKSELTSVLSGLKDTFTEKLEKRRKEFPEKLMKDFEQRTGVADPQKFAELLQNLGRSGEYFSDRFSQRMNDLAKEVVADEAEARNPKDEQT